MQSAAKKSSKYNGCLIVIYMLTWIRCDEKVCKPSHPKDLARDWYEFSYAVLIGINQYADPSVDSLNYCVNDVREMQSCLDKLNFTTKILINHEATKRNIQREVLDVAARMKDEHR